MHSYKKSVELVNTHYGRVTIDVLTVCPEVDPSIIFQINKLIRMNYMACAAILKDNSKQVFVYRTLVTGDDRSKNLERLRVIGTQFMDLGDGFDFNSLIYHYFTYPYPNVFSRKTNVPEEYISKLESIVTEAFQNIKNLWISKVE